MIVGVRGGFRKYYLFDGNKGFIVGSKSLL